MRGGRMTGANFKDRLLIGISGASGAIYGIRLLELLQDSGLELHLVITPTAELTIAYETSYKLAKLYGLAHHYHRYDDLAAPIASGSFRMRGMIVAPCSVRTLAEIGAGTGGNLLTRAADVMLKERRRLVLMVRETPLHLGHLRSMVAVTEMGAIIAPPVPAFYARPQSLQDMVDQSLGRVLDVMEIPSPLTRRWGEDITRKRP